jgi:hypothetical protein
MWGWDASHLESFIFVSAEVEGKQCLNARHQVPWTKVYIIHAQFG